MGYLSVEARRRIAALILIAGVVIAAVLIARSVFGEPEPTQEERVAGAVEEFFQAASGGDFERNCELLTKEAQDLMRASAARVVEETEERLSCAQLLQVVVGESFADVTVRVLSVSISGNRARAEAALKPEGEPSQFRTILLEQDDENDWLISDFG